MDERRHNAGLIFIYNVNTSIDSPDLLDYINFEIPTKSRRNSFISSNIPFYDTNYGQNSPLD